MADESTNYEINVVGNDNGIKEIAGALENLGGSFSGLQKALGQISRGFDNAGKSMAGIKTDAKEATTAIEAATKSAGTLASEFARSQRNKLHPGLAASEFTREHAATKIAAIQAEAAAKRQAEEEGKVLAQLKLQNDARRASLQLMRDARQAGGYAPGNSGPQTGTGPGSAQAVALRMRNAGTFAAVDAAEAKAAADAIARVKKENLDAAEAALQHANRLTNMRYSLYEVQNTAMLTVAALAAVNIGTLAAAATYETAMAQISRTSGITGEQLNSLRADFVDLAQTVPTAFSDLADIGTLAGQLNIPADRIAAFTETTAKFTATTNVAAEQSATAFGRLDALLDDVNGNYEALGSSILNVGVNSVATETEIIAVTNQITAAAQQAGFAADEIIGLAASFASLGVPAESSRGTVLRTFSVINNAVATTNEDLGKLASFAGQSAKDFADAWDNAPAEAFQSALNGMQEAAANGQNLEVAMRDMGITAQRDLTNLLKLAQNADIVASNFGYAADGFNEATALGEAFDTQAATLASKLQVLASSLQALFATLGQSGLGPVGAMIDLLNGMLQVITDLASSPFVQWSAVVVGSLTALAAVATLIVAGVSRMATAVIAGSQAMAAFRVEVAAATGQTLSFKSAMDYASTSMTGSATAARVLRGALLGLGIFGAIAVAGGVVAETVTAIADSMKSASDRAKETYGDVSALTDALVADTEAAKNGGAVYGYVSGELTQITRTTSDWAATLQEATGQQITADGAIEETTESLGQQTYAIGENAKAWAAQQLTTGDLADKMQEFLKYADEVAKAGGPKLDQAGFLTALTENDTAKATELVREWGRTIEAEYANSVGQYGEVEMIDYDMNLEMIENMKREISTLGGAFENSANRGEYINKVMDAAGISTENAANAAKYGAELMDEFGNSAGGAADRASLLGDSVSNAFANQNVMGQWVTDSYALAQGIAEGGNAFDYLGEAGIANMNNLQSSVVSTIMAGSAMGMSTAESVGSLFMYLQELGVDTAELMRQVAAAAGVSVSAVQAAMDKPTPQMTYMADAMGQIQQNAEAAAASIGGSGSNSVAGAAKEAAKEVRTLVDLANDIQSVFDRAYEIRFSVEEAQDDAMSIFYQMVEDAEDAKDKVSDLRADINGLNADLKSLKAERKSLNYFLDVAVEYDDDLRAGEINAELGEVEAEIGETRGDLKDKNDDLADAQKELSKSTKGNSQTAVENRQKLRELQRAHLDSIDDFIATGASQEEIAEFVAEAEQKFKDQAKALGYATDEVEPYLAAFDDIETIIDGIPRDLTVTADANTDPALTALREFRAKAGKIGEQAGNNFNKGFNVGGKAALKRAADLRSYYTKYVIAMAQAAIYSLRASLSTDPITAVGLRSAAIAAQVTALGYRKLAGFKTGGYTGDGGVSRVAGVVHGKEFVVNAENTAKFRPILEAMNRGQMPAMAVPVNSGGGYTELSPTDRALLRDLRNMQIVVNGRVLGEVTNAANFTANRRGVS